jgi:endonuclease/exonuclease/phosphatase family metal-dependent hydrolase
VIIFLWNIPFYMAISGNRTPPPLKLLQNNYGQNHGFALQPYIDRENPDFVALEEGNGYEEGFRRGNPGRTVTVRGQFILISKEPVHKAELMPWPLWHGAPVGARFVTTWNGKEMVIYAIHLPTPRNDFGKLAGVGLIREMIGHNGGHIGSISFAESMRQRVELARELSDVFDQETEPFVAMGDFNAPSDGFVHHVVTRNMVDAFAAAGRGFGFTFPGDAHNPLSLGEPWLRIDYILAGPGWQVTNCWVEPGRRSEHRAVVATLRRG